MTSPCFRYYQPPDPIEPECACPTPFVASSMWCAECEREYMEYLLATEVRP